MGWLFAMLKSVPVALGLASKGIDYFIKRADGNVQIALSLMAAEQARIAAQRDITVAAMGHPIFWVMWILFVLPLGIYWCKVIVYDKVLALGATDPLTGFILEWAGWIVGSIFCLQIGTGIVSSVLNRLTGKR